MHINDWSSDMCSSDLGVEVHRAGIEVERADEQPLAIHCKGLGVRHRGAGTQHRAIAAAAAARAGAEEAAPGPLSIGAIGPAHFEKPDTGLEQRLSTLRIARMDAPHIGRSEEQTSD